MHIMEIYKIFSELESHCDEPYENPWVIRLEFNRRLMMDKKITMGDIYQVINNSIKNISCVYSDDNANKLISLKPFKNKETGLVEMIDIKSDKNREKEHLYARLSVNNVRIEKCE